MLCQGLKLKSNLIPQSSQHSERNALVKSSRNPSRALSSLQLALFLSHSPQGRGGLQTQQTLKLEGS